MAMFTEPILIRALLAALFLGPLCALLGDFVTARRMSFFSDTISHAALAGVALVFGVVNAFVKPILTLLSLPAVVLTLGFFLLVLNALMLMLTSGLSTTLGLGFHVAGFWPAFWGSIVISVVSTLLSVMLPSPPRQGRPQ